MLRTNRVLVFVFLVLLCGACGPRVAVVHAADVNELLDSLPIKLDIAVRRFSQEQWKACQPGIDDNTRNADSLEFFRGLRRAVLTDDEDFVTLKGARSRIDDNLDERRYDLVYAAMLEARLTYGGNVRALYDSVAGAFNGKWCRFQDSSYSPHELGAMLARSDRRTDRELAYRALSAPPSDVAGEFGRLLRLRNQTAKRMGFNDSFRLLLSASDMRAADYSDLIDAVDEATRPAYEKYVGSGGGSTEMWDLSHRLAAAVGDLDVFFAVDSQVRVLKRSMLGAGFDLDALPVYFLFPDSAAKTPDLVLAVDIPGDIRVVYTPTDGIDGMRRLLGQVGVALSLALNAQDEMTFKRLRSPELTEGCRLYFESLPLQDGWLEAYAGVPKDQADRYRQAARNANVVRLRQLLLAAAFEQDAYSNPNQDLNKLYWQLFGSYMDLPRHDDLQPWATDTTLLTDPLGHYASLVGYVIAAQTAAYLQEHFGPPVDNRDVRAFLLQNFFRFGSRYPWKETVERAIGGQFSPEALEP